ncbi:hypothetical protein GOODEAATRI_006113 [Goodea atripinnis]|uniref:Uncharacterized protein n=1 Tax=Goodea atripinnis TaxID=208336 RepID=A0ABV0P231_9TELE
MCVCFRSKQGIGGREAPMKATKPWNNRRFIGTFDVENTTKGDSGRYRCIVHSDKGVGVSNYGELTIKRCENLLCQADAVVGQDAAVTKSSASLVNITAAAVLGPLGTFATFICA